MDDKKEFVFEIKEIRYRFNPNYAGDREAYLYVRTGTASIKGDEIEVYVDDKSQPSEMLEVKDNKFKKLLKTIFHGGE